MRTELKYCCSNPDCREKFTLEQAKHDTTMIQLEDYVYSRITPLSVSLVHILCPKCNTIATSFHIPNHD